jgi:hypothetical protein
MLHRNDTSIERTMGKMEQGWTGDGNEKWKKFRKAGTYSVVFGKKGITLALSSSYLGGGSFCCASHWANNKTLTLSAWVSGVT